MPKGYTKVTIAGICCDSFYPVKYDPTAHVLELVNSEDGSCITIIFRHYTEWARLLVEAMSTLLEDGRNENTA